MKRRLTILIVAGLVAGACASAPNSPHARVRASAPLTPTGSVQESPFPSLPAEGLRLVEGGSAFAGFPQRGATVFIHLSHSVSLSRQTFFLSADRTGRCRSERVGDRERISVCDTIWSIENRRITPSEFEFDPLLGRARASFTLRGRPITIVWRGSGDIRRQIDSGSSVPFIEQRDARVAIRWGSRTWGWPDDFDASQAGRGSLFRRADRRSQPG